MRAWVKYNGIKAGELWKEGSAFCFGYLDGFLESGHPPISLTLPKQKGCFRHEGLHPFFFNLLPEGEVKKALCLTFNLSPKDDFSLLLKVASMDCIGAVTLEKQETDNEIG